MKLNSVQGLNDLAISRSSLADDFEIKDADGSNIRVPARAAVRQALDTWRNKDKRARVKAGYGEALLRTQFGEAWERLPEVRRDAMVNLLETAISMESTVLPPKR
jgi:hypothetical protein